MSYPQVYTFILAAAIILHRLPGVLSPMLFKKIVHWYTSEKMYVIGGGIALSLLSLAGIYVTLADYPRFGWLIIGLSIVFLHKASKFVFRPGRAAFDEREAWDQPNQNVFLICLGSAISGVALLLMSLIIM